MIARRANAVVVLTLLFASRVATGQGSGQLEDLLAKVVRARYAALHRCFRRSLSEDRARGGTVFVRLGIGAGGRVSHAKLERDELKHAPTVECLLSEVGQWQLRGVVSAGVEVGSELVLPLTFQADPHQRVVARQDVVARVVRGGKIQVLLGRKNVGVTVASMTLLEVSKKVSLPCVSGRRQVIVVLDGRGQISHGSRRRSLRAGVVAKLADGKSTDIRRRGRKPLKLLHFFVPGRERWQQAPTAQIRCPQLVSVTRLPTSGKGYVLDRLIKRSRPWTGERLIFVTRGTARTATGHVVGEGHAIYLVNNERLQPGRGFVAIRFQARTALEQRLHPGRK